ncbi:DUF805 domain-containing protein [Ideonella azotifigens]|uniref:DUF805 domain-containing protein n=1 Tax=Ideonella azotifigens TaxID=513160 RepID=A0ABP3UXJ1_9BURK|nr:DUF805 domain-containing protein [Ideonella azotifigens]MCD2340112.1 DUF805 domain-containing protein [Ideonella azotifigens]
MTEAVNPFQPPNAELILPASSEKPDLKTLYFSFQGRISRKVFWLYGVLFFFLAMLVLGGVVGAVALVSETLSWILAVPLYIAGTWIGLAMQVKRWHDRDKSGWWILIGLIPVIGSIWAFIETGCLRGTVGPNRFGDDLTDQY